MPFVPLAIDLLRQSIQARTDKPQGWNTQIPELLISPFNQQDVDQVRECTWRYPPSRRV
jgi:hypothetical protein